MSEQKPRVYLNYDKKNEGFVERVALWLKKQTNLTFFYEPLNAIDDDIQEMIENELERATCCAVFLEDASVEDFHNEVMRLAIQKRVKGQDKEPFRIIPVYLPKLTKQKDEQDKLSMFLKRYRPVEFQSCDDQEAYQSLLAGILKVPFMELDEYFTKQPKPFIGSKSTEAEFGNGHALVVGIANYPQGIRSLSGSILNDSNAFYETLTSQSCGYPTEQVRHFKDEEATKNNIVGALESLAQNTSNEDTVVIYFSGHGKRNEQGGTTGQYLVPYDTSLRDPEKTAIRGEDFTHLIQAIPADRVIVFFDCCHAGGIGEAKTPEEDEFETGLSLEFYKSLGEGKGRVVMASSRPTEESYAFDDMENSIFTHFLLQAFAGEIQTKYDDIITIFDIFDHLSLTVSPEAFKRGRQQHPILKINMLETNFAVALKN